MPRGERCLFPVARHVKTFDLMTLKPRSSKTLAGVAPDSASQRDRLDILPNRDDTATLHVRYSDIHGKHVRYQA